MSSPAMRRVAVQMLAAAVKRRSRVENANVAGSKDLARRMPARPAIAVAAQQQPSQNTPFYPEFISGPTTCGFSVPCRLRL
jgi:hypothetical protein